MSDGLNSFPIWLNGIAHTISTITSVPSGNKKFELISWALRIIAQIIEITLGIILLAKDIVPKLQEIKTPALRNESNSSVIEYQEAAYQNAAYGYIVFFSLEIASDLTIWAFLAVKGPKKFSTRVLLFFSVFFELPIMYCILLMMRAQGTINWDKQGFELLFHVWFFVNIMLQFTVGYAEKVAKEWHYAAVILLVPFSYLILCLPYAFVILPISSRWNRGIPFSGYLEDSQKFIHGTFTSSHAHNMFDFLIFSAFVGQWTWTIISVTGSLVLFGFCIKSVACGCLKAIFGRSN